MFEARVYDHRVPRAAILDIDGTLVDTNYHHALSWFRAFRREGLVVPIWRIHRSIGMGGDQLVQAVAGEQFERDHGDDVRAAEGELYMETIDEVAAFEGASELIAELQARGSAVVLASSAKAEEVDHYLELLGAREVVDGWTTSADVEATKPAPDLVEVALEKAGDEAAMVGDTVFDCHAAARAGVPTIGLLSGGVGEAELREAGAVACFESLGELRSKLDSTPLAT